MEWISLLWIRIGDLAISTLGNHCGNSRSLNQFSTSQLFSHEATFFVAKIFDNVKYKKHTTNKFRSSHTEVFCKECVLRNFAKFTGKQKCHSFFFNKVAAPELANLLKKRHWHRCFPVNFVQFIRAPLFPSIGKASPDWNKTIDVMPEIKPAMLCWGNYSVSSTFVATS